MIIYIAGPITGIYDYRDKFAAAEQALIKKGHIPINPAYLPNGLGKTETYMHICHPMINVSDAIYLLDGWENLSLIHI